MTHYLAIPLKKNDIRQFVQHIVKSFKINTNKPFPVLHFIENILPEWDEDFTFDIVPDSDLKREYAKTYPLEHRIVVRQSVYDGAYNNDSFCRTVLAHELGHYFLHTKQTICFAKSANRQSMPKEYSVEWQADIFAYELLLPYDAVKATRNYKELSKRYNVTLQDAKKRTEFVHREIEKKAKAQKRKAKSFNKRFGHH